MQPRKNSSSRPWYLYLMAVVAAVIVALGISQIGPPSSSARVSREVVQAENGVVQSTVSGTGNVEPATDAVVNFATGGTLQSVDVAVGQHVHKGQLLATLDPTSAELALAQAQATLTAAKDNLKAAKDGTSTSSGSPSSSASLDDVSSAARFVDYTPPKGKYPTKPGSKKKSSTKPGSKGTSGSSKKSTTTGSKTGTTGTTGTGTTGSAHTGTTTGTTTTTVSPSQVASAEASVDTATASVDSAEQTVADTKLYAPVGGTIASLASVSLGEAISTSGSSDSGTSGSSTTGSSSTGSSGSETAGSLGSSSASSSSSTSSSGFAEIINSSTLTMTVALSESDISSVKVGQSATVSMDALSGVELGAHVSSISPLATTSSGVVSYNATLTLDQTNPKVRPGMSASATVITAQAQGVTVPNQAITGSGSSGTVQVQQNGKTVTLQVVVGLRGSSRSEIISGLRAGQDVVVTVTLPALGTSTTSSSSSTGTLGGGLAGAGALGRGGGGFAGGGGFFGRGAGGGGGG